MIIIYSNFLSSQHSRACLYIKRNELTAPNNGDVIAFQRTTVPIVLLRAKPVVVVVVRYIRHGGQWKDVGCGRWN